MNAKRPVSLLFSLLFLSICHAEARSNSAIRAFNSGVQHFNAGEFNAAVPYFDEAISADADFTEALYARGACKYYLKSFNGAALDLNRVIRAQPEHVGARAIRGAVHYETDRWDDALQDFNFVLQRKPSDAQALLGRGVIRLKREDMTGAARDFRGFLRVRPNDPLAPEIRKVLASIGSVDAESGGAAASPRRAMSQQEINQITARLMANPLAENYQRKAMRGEGPQAVGDIHSVPTAAPPSRKTPSDYQGIDTGSRY